MKYCGKCQEWMSDKAFVDHMAQHNQHQNSDAVEHKQYTGFSKKSTEDYAVCMLHQKKCPCPVQSCNLQPFGWKRKSEIQKAIRNGYLEWSDRFGSPLHVKIEPETNIVTLYGVPIKLRQ